MSWQESRGVPTTTARREAHTDDAKERSDDATRMRARASRAVPATPRPRWLVPAAVTAAIVILGGGAAAAVMGTDDEPPQAVASAPTASASSVSDPTSAPTTPSASAGASPSAAAPTTSSASLYFTTVGQNVVTQQGRQTSSYKATYRIDCRTGPCTVFNPITKTTVVLPKTGPNTWTLPADPLPTNPCDTPSLGDPDFPRGTSTMTITDTGVRTTSSFAGFTLRGGGCYAFAAAWNSVYTGDRRPL